MCRARITPPAGPLSTRRTGNRHAVSTVQTPPEDIISSSGQSTQATQTVVRIRPDTCHQRQHIGVGDVVEVRSYSRISGTLRRHVIARLGQRRAMIARPPLVRRIDVGVQETDRHASTSARCSVST